MPKKNYLNLKVDESLQNEVSRTAKEDDRKTTDQLRYLIRLGLQLRGERRSLEQSVIDGKTQINAQALRRS